MHFNTHLPLLTKTPYQLHLTSQNDNKKKKSKNCLVFIKNCSDSYKRLKKFNIMDTSLSYIHRLKEIDLSTQVNSNTPIISRIDEVQKISFLPPIKSEQMIRRFEIGNELKIVDLKNKEEDEKITQYNNLSVLENKRNGIDKKLKRFIFQERKKHAETRKLIKIKVKKIISTQAVQVNFGDDNDLRGWE